MLAKLTISILGFVLSTLAYSQSENPVNTVVAPQKINFRDQHKSGDEPKWQENYFNAYQKNSKDVIDTCEPNDSIKSSIDLNTTQNVGTKLQFEKISKTRESIEILSKKWFLSDSCKENISKFLEFITTNEPNSLLKEYQVDFDNHLKKNASDSSKRMEKEKDFQASQNNLVIFIFVVMLLLNFIFYKLFRPLRFLLIPPPYQIGIKIQPGSVEEKIRSKKGSTDLFMLIGMASIYFLWLTMIQKPDANFTFGFSLFVYGLLHLLFLIVRFLEAYGDRCPKCKALYGVETETQYFPKSTYNKSKSDGKIEHREVGNFHADHECLVCKEHWESSGNYDRVINTSN